MTIPDWSENYAMISGFGFQGRCLTLVIALLLFFVVLAFIILSCLRVDNIISSSWALVFIPVWVLDTIYYGIALFSLIFRSRKLYTMCKELLLLVVQLVAVMRLDGVFTSSLTLLLSPYVAYECLNLLETMAGGILGYRMLVYDSIGAGTFQADGIEAERQLLVKAVVRKICWILLRGAQALLIGLKIDGKLEETTWWWVLVPVWVLVAYLVCYPIKKYTRSTSTNRLMDAILTASVIFMLVSPLFLLTERLNGKMLSSFEIVMPWTLLMSISFMFVFCTISWASSERLIPSGVQPTRRHARTASYRDDYVAIARG
ncbi:hypothetical protein PsorP6_018218 [Peronosclerospora sorghi]|uniref:Uncharacterized protein n=1 Tax=Peronosclerospora sorghi TaxID=230839 RepID=A0ACC0WDJ0_9STRA|nr:hypothetical protein PsorP6_018218 [Peronosclerospora sorghi]